MDRRRFISNYIPAGLMVPSFVSGVGFRAYASGHQLLDNYLLPAGDNDRVLVVIQLNGGNDGLNTVIPLDKFGQYYNARKNVFIAQEKALRLDRYAQVGLHPAMTGMQQLFNEGKMHIVQSVGYPRPNFSPLKAIRYSIQDGWAVFLMNSIRVFPVIIQTMRCRILWQYK
jgi:hypothetical protein